MPTDKRQRHKRAHRARQQQAARSARHRRRSRWVSVLALLGAAGFILALVLNYAQTGKQKAQPPPASSTTSTSSDLGIDPSCPRADGRTVRQTHFRRAPPICINFNSTYIAHVRTDAGSFDITLNANEAPNTVNNFVVLARYHFYDGLAVKKIVQGDYIQMGDPPGTATDAGYLFADELPPAGQYRVGSVIMANSGANTNGSQFIVLSGQDIIPSLNPPKFTLFGQVTSGMDVIDQLNATPQAPHVVQEISITES